MFRRRQFWRSSAVTGFVPIYREPQEVWVDQTCPGPQVQYAMTIFNQTQQRRPGWQFIVPDLNKPM
ncbi:hypothetical protein M378DRAFT_160140 [Amanita muscaria Koide BX008]|uniref:Uncharacterized protein n=1 Tax=Amanita muscaria (strain Koide BX008) TaxID=946122 RepID=A0A0C2SUN7_AMAMK|nr:hypothetical protein M378DRAFT_160140 [Amanita muscaria Koide BX008]